MLYNTKLNEFEPRQIASLLHLIAGQMETLNGTLNRIESWEDSQLKHDIYLETQTDLDDLILWKVQLSNALSDIEEINKINIG